MKEGTEARVCVVCEQVISPEEEPHYVHDEDCTEDTCSCDRPVHPDCCPEEGCR